MMSVLSFSCSVEIDVRSSSIGVYLSSHLGSSPLSRTSHFLKIHIFIDFREEGRGRESNISDEKESLIGCLLHAPYWRRSPQPGHVP
jgi:hypothetical protein